MKFGIRLEAGAQRESRVQADEVDPHWGPGAPKP